MYAEPDTLRVRLLSHLPRHLPVRYFVMFSLVPILVAFFMSSFSDIQAFKPNSPWEPVVSWLLGFLTVTQGPMALLDALSPFLLTLFVSMIVRIPELFRYDKFESFLDGLSDLPVVVGAYLRVELSSRRTVSYFCLANGIVAVLCFAAIKAHPPHDGTAHVLTLAVLFFVVGSFCLYCANQIQLAVLERYVDSLERLEELRQDSIHG